MNPNFQEYLEQTSPIKINSDKKANNHLIDKTIFLVQKAGDGSQNSMLSSVDVINEILIEAIEKLEKLKK